ncbi:MAG: tetratricopeptide repeat protein, partial [Calditrichaeota bacterium]|nr:tetratricopeptide repeat protein [Calditrichota bacterium]
MALLFSLVATAGYGQVALEQEDYNYAYRLYNDGLYDLAGAQFLRFAQFHPESPRAAECVFMAGRSFLQAGQLAKAKSAFSRVILEFPQSNYVDRALFGLADVYVRQSRPCEAAASLERVSILTPNSPRKGKALVQAARWYSTCGRKSHAARLLEAVLHDFRGTNLADIAKLELARLRLQTGRPDLAEKLLDQLKVGQTSDSLAAEANLVAGRLYSSLLRFDKARERLRLVAEGAPLQTQKARAILELAELELAQRNAARASELLGGLPTRGLPDSLLWRVRILRAAAAVCAGNRPESLTLFNGTAGSLPEQVRREVLLARALVASGMNDSKLLAGSARALWQTVKEDSTPQWPVTALKLWIQSGATEAVRAAAVYAQSYPAVDSLYGITVLAARELLKHPDQRGRGQGLLNQFLLRFPEAPDADLASFLLARTQVAASARRARADLENWLKQFAESEVEPQVRTLADSIDLYVPTLGPNQAKLLLRLAAESSASTPSARQYLEAARVALSSLKDYRLASVLARQAAASGLRGGELGQALDVIGQSFLRLSQVAARAGELERSHQLADSARLVFDLALRRTPSADNCGLKRALAAAILASSEDVTSKLSKLETLAGDSTNICPGVLLSLSKALWDLSGHGEHDSTAVAALRKAALAARGSGPQAEEAAFLLVQIALTRRDSTLADSATATYLRRFGPEAPHWGSVSLSRATLLLAKGYASEASTLLRNVVSRRTYSDLSDSARVLWAKAERLRSNPAAALRILRGVRDPGLVPFGNSRLPAWTICFQSQQLGFRAEAMLEA